MIEQGLVDESFVARRTTGFEALKAHLRAFTPERMAPICGIDAETIRSVARIYASSRASIAFVRGARARAAIAGRTFVLPDDVKMLAHEILCHRILLTREVEIEGLKPADIVDEILATIEVP